jgi:Zn-dependent protease
MLPIQPGSRRRRGGTFKNTAAAVDGVGVFGAAPPQVSLDGSMMLVRRPVPIVVTPGGLVPLAVFALLFVAFSGGSEASVLVGAALLGGIGGVVSLIVHELGHVSIARRLSGVRPTKVSLICLGAATQLEGSYRSGREQARMALGGPEASLAFALALMVPVLLPTPVWLKLGALGLALLNMAIAILSLLPVHPLDGHKLIVGLVWWAVGSEAKARRIIRRVGIGLLAVDVSTVALLLAERPVIGLTVAALVGVALAQRRLLGRPAGV